MTNCQKILCSVGSCVYNAGNENLCTLGAVQVSPSAKSDSNAPYDETLCASYRTKQQMK